MSNLGALDMALDDVISQNRSSRRSNNTNNNNNSKSNTRRSGSGGGINKPRSSGGRSPYGSRPSRNNNNNNTRSNNTKPVANRANNSLVVANLHFNVTEKDLYDLFGQIGPLKRAFLHIGPNGKSAGIADVVFQSSHDAERARNTYNNVELDGRPMRITVASIVSAVAPAPSPRRVGNVRGANNRGGPRRNTNRTHRPKPTEDQLDADMDSYMGGSEDVQMN
ncbi:uncharacterized protein B0P05DRAFT_546580 [Gilbertella persicaria]|uniref:uncharacterized protein n=1 Tax=Gilbertella persicaria TaxID=101096 RepID=UPI0022203469|nr:uncharacterized protein B0P05DRAFT_546580 [Gilbertella persicaria]KAI8075832.1 hypothetical protein B0P05DRAFT_546580 [Gilbertella persicaria]